jgi:lipid-A-disaccharide synthase
MLFLSAGEVSGDLYGAALLKQLSAYFSGPYYGLGGPLLREAGQQQLDDVLAYSAVGLTENLAHLPRFRRLWKRIKGWLRQCRPTAVILIDFQGLNLRIGAYARRLGIPVFYFIAPQAWLWRSPGDLKRIAQSCDLILSVFLPEHHFYQSRGIPSVFVGHPLLDLLPTPDAPIHAPAEGFETNTKRSICWLPGSRPIEVKRLTAVLRDLIQRYEQRYPGQYTHVMPVATPALLPLLSEAFGDLPVLRVPASERYQAMLSSERVFGASGSAILEAVLLEKPTVALYRVSGITYAIAQRVFHHPHITLPNLLLHQALVPEFVQSFDTPAIFKSAESLSPRAFKVAAAALRAQLQSAQMPCVATERAALEIRNHMKSNGRR